MNNNNPDVNKYVISEHKHSKNRTLKTPSLLYPNLFSLILVLLLIMLNACSLSTDSNESTAFISISLPSHFQKTKNNLRNKANALIGLPPEADKVKVIVLNEIGEIISQGDLLTADENLDLAVAVNVPLQVKGEIWAGEELIYAGTQIIAPLYVGEQRPISLVLESMVVFNFQTPVKPVNTSQTQNFSVEIQGLNNTEIKWYVDGIEGGDATVGFIDQVGNYTRPEILTKAEVTIKAISIAAPSFEQEITNTLVEIPKSVPVLTGISGDSLALLKWNVIDNASEYFIYRSDATVTKPQLVIKTVEAEYRDFGLENDTTYSYFVSASNIAGQGGNSNNVEVTPEKPELPQVPTGLNATTENGSVILHWNTASKANSYVIYRVENLVDLNQAIPLTETTASTYQDNTVISDVEYFYTISAKNSLGEGNKSNILPVTVQKPALPVTPTGLNVKAGDKSITLNWNEIDKATSYVIYRAQNLADLNQAIPLTETTTSTYQDNSVISDVEYFYAVSSKNTAGESVFSTVATAKFIENSQKPISLNKIVDDNLRACIEDHINYIPTTLEELSYLQCEGRNINTLKGLEQFDGLLSLVLDSNSIYDITPVANLTSLTTLLISGNQIADITSVADLTLLNIFAFTNNKITDISPLTNLTSLTELYFSFNQIIDITPVTSLTSLNILHFYNNQITDISPLANLTLLNQLNLSSNLISDISPVSSLPNLNTLRFEHNQITDISPLANLTLLNSLSVKDNQISEISSVSNLTSLVNLNFNSNQISDITPVTNLTFLRYLHSSNNKITDISPVENLTSLIYLDLGSNQINDISPVENLASLNDLYFQNNQITDISPVTNLISLNQLYFSNNQITDISPVTNFQFLNALDLANNQIEDIGPVKYLSLLNLLFLDANQIIDVNPIANLKRLTELRLNQNPKLLCSSVESIDMQIDGSDGDSSGLVKWDACIP